MDNPHRLRPGTVQAMGADAVGIVWELSDKLSSATEKLLEISLAASALPSGESKTGNASASPAPPSAAQVVASLGDPAERSVYFDVLGLIFVSYSRRVGLWLHSLPLALSVLLALAAASAPALARRRGGAGVGVGSGAKNGDDGGLLSLRGVAAATFAASLSAVGAVALPALLGAALATLTRRPMGWFGAGGGGFGGGSSFLGVAAFAPAAVAGALWPYSLLSPPSSPPSPSSSSPRARALGCAPAALLGAAITTGAVAAALAAAMYGSAYAFALWSVSCCLSSLALLLLAPSASSPREKDGEGVFSSPSSLLVVLLLALPALVTAPDALVLSLHILQKASFAGSPFPPPLSLALSDAAAGAVVGACSLSVMGGVPALAAAAMTAVEGERRRRRRTKKESNGRSPSLVTRASLALALASVAILLSCSALRTPHSPLAPKKVFLQLVHRLETTKGSKGSTGPTTSVASSRWLGGGVDAVPSAPFLPESLGPWGASPGQGHALEWLSLFPLGKILETSEGGLGVRWPGDAEEGAPPRPPRRPPPAVKLVSRAPVAVAPSASSSSSSSPSSSSPSSSSSSPPPPSLPRERVELALDISDPSIVSRGVFGALNVTGRVLRWSLTDSFSSPKEVSTSFSPSSSSSSSLPPWRIVRFGGVPLHVAEEAAEAKKKNNGKNGRKKKNRNDVAAALPYWRFWLEVPQGERISIAAAVSAVGIGATPDEAEALDALFAPEVSSALVESWVGEWEF
jgi:hypothetical protein